MGSKDPRVDQFISEANAFAKPILLHLRNQVHAACPETTETIKWSMPFFEYKGKILCHMAAFKAHCAFGFWHGKLLEINARQSTAMGQFGRITSLADLPTDKQIADVIKAAMKLHDQGVKSPIRAKASEKKELIVPDYFLTTVKKNKLAFATFNGFSPSKKKEYVEWITEAKTDATRDKRLAQAVEWMAEGKVRNWKYLNC